MAWMRRCWLYQGASQAMLKEILSFGEKAREQDHQAMLMSRGSGPRLSTQRLVCSEKITEITPGVGAEL